MPEPTTPAGGAASAPCDSPSASSGVSAKASIFLRPPSSCPSALARHFRRLPTELRLKVWQCAAEPRVIILDDLIRRPEAYPLPSVAQVNREARFESRRGYEAVGPRKSSHVDFGRDIFVCDATITDTTANEPLEELATRVERLAFWDCYPDDTRVDVPVFYAAYLAASQAAAAANAALISAGAGSSSSGMTTSPSGLRLPAVDFDKLWFPNLRDLWIVKLGGVNNAWMIDADVAEQEAAAEKAAAAGAPSPGQPSTASPRPPPPTLSHHSRSRETARKFRYWVQDNVVEMAPLNLDDPETRLVLRDGRCGRPDCHEINRGRPLLVSKVTFMEGKYRPSQGWLRIAPWDGRASSASTSGNSTPGHNAGDGTGADAINSSRNSMRWVVVERILTFSLRWESSDDTDKRSRRHVGSQNHA